MLERGSSTRAHWYRRRAPSVTAAVLSRPLPGSPRAPLALAGPSPRDRRCHPVFSARRFSRRPYPGLNAGPAEHAASRGPSPGATCHRRRRGAPPRPRSPSPGARRSAAAPPGTDGQAPAAPRFKATAAGPRPGRGRPAAGAGRPAEPPGTGTCAVRERTRPPQPPR